jgi:hypothetical protein
MGNWEGKKPLRRPRCRRWIILKWILEKGWSGMNWMHLAEDEDQWKALMDMVVMNSWLRKVLESS